MSGVLLSARIATTAESPQTIVASLYRLRGRRRCRSRCWGELEALVARTPQPRLTIQLLPPSCVDDGLRLTVALGRLLSLIRAPDPPARQTPAGEHEQRLPEELQHQGPTNQDPIATNRDGQVGRLVGPHFPLPVLDRTEEGSREQP